MDDAEVIRMQEIIDFINKAPLASGSVGRLPLCSALMLIIGGERILEVVFANSSAPMHL